MDNESPLLNTLCIITNKLVQLKMDTHDTFDLVWLPVFLFNSLIDNKCSLTPLSHYVDVHLFLRPYPKSMIEYELPDKTKFLSYCFLVAGVFLSYG